MPAAVTRSAVKLLIALAACDAPTFRRLSVRMIVGTVFAGAGKCCLGWGVWACR